MTSIEFEDTVMSFCTEARQVNVLFKRQAASYEVTNDNDNFASVLEGLAVSWRDQQPVRVTVQGAEIVSVEFGK